MTALPVLDLWSDLHVHSTFSDDAVSTQEENVAAAGRQGLHTLGLVDHVRRTTAWAPRFAVAARALDGVRSVRVLCGVEAKMLDTSGAVDLPPSLPDLDYVLVADHQLPRPGGPLSPRAAAAALAAGDLDPGEVVEDLIEATVAALGCHRQVVVAHPFSILPKCGLREDDVPEALVRRLGRAARAAGAAIEVNEKWRCPTPRVIRLLCGTGVTLTLGSDAHHERDVGRYAYVRDAVSGPARPPHGPSRPAAPAASAEASLSGRGRSRGRQQVPTRRPGSRADPLGLSGRIPR